MATTQSSTDPQQRSIRPLLFTLLILTLLIGASYIGRLRSLSALDQKIATAQLHVQQAQSRQQMLKDERTRQLDTSEESIDQAARRDLNLVKPGEFIFTVLTPMPSSLVDLMPTPAPEVVASQPVPTKSNWRQWMELLLPKEDN